MEKLKSLENQRLVSQLSYKQNDYEYKQELLTQVDVQFQDSILKVLEEYPSIGEMYNSKLKEIEKNITQIVKDEPTDNNSSESIIESSDVDVVMDVADFGEIEIVDNPRNTKIKNLYREIVKITHPDKTKNKNLNNIYIEATDFYNISDFVELLLVGHKVGIEIELDDQDVSEIIDKIKFYEDRMNLMESTYTWAWYSTNDENTKNNILLSYIKGRII